MILPIIAYGDPVLRKVASHVQAKDATIIKLIEDMFETMHNASGVGLAAPQVGHSLRIFIVDGSPLENKEVKDFKRIFINAEIFHQNGEEWSYNEGCLSIPKIREDIKRQPEIGIRFLDENFVKHEEIFKGMAARIIQHEYDHIEGVLFIDHISGLRKRLMKNKLTDISRGKVEVDYRMKFPSK